MNGDCNLLFLYLSVPIDMCSLGGYIKSMDILPKKFRDKFIVNGDGCWMWVAGKDSGYGRFMHEGKSWRTHRLAWTLLVGDISDGLVVNHYRNDPGERHAPCSKACCNPEHLEITTVGGNIRGHHGTALRDVCTHFEPRRGKAGQCLMCISEYNKAYYKEHRGKDVKK